MDISALVNAVKKDFKKTFKEADCELDSVDKQLPPTGIVLDNPLMEYLVDRRFVAYGRCYLLYGKKGCGKTTFLFELAKTFIRNGGHWFWIETENAPDFRYMELQGVDPTKTHYHNPKTLEEALTIISSIIKNIRKIDPEQTTPIMIALDSVAGAATEYERDQNVIGATMVAGHAKLMAGFYRHIVPLLETEKAILVVTNQLREQIGGMKTFGQEAAEALIGGEAQRFNSTYQWKFARTKDLLLPDHMNVERKAGSCHSITVKRNKLGREGNSQKIEVDFYWNGGIDWYTPLVEMLGAKYPSIVNKSGGWYKWKIPNTPIADGSFIDTEQTYRAGDLAAIIMESTAAKEVIRQAFGIPDMPAPEVEKEVERKNKARRKKPTDLEQDVLKAEGGDDVVVLDD